MEVFDRAADLTGDDLFLSYVVNNKPSQVSSYIDNKYRDVKEEVPAFLEAYNSASRRTILERLKITPFVTDHIDKLTRRFATTTSQRRILKNNVLEFLFRKDDRVEANKIADKIMANPEF